MTEVHVPVAPGTGNLRPTEPINAQVDRRSANPGLTGAILASFVSRSKKLGKTGAIHAPVAAGSENLEYTQTHV